MLILLSGFGIFFTAFFLHVFIWRILPHLASMRNLFRIFLWIFASAIFLIWFYASPRSYINILHICLLYASISSTYIITYSAVEAESPTILIINEIMKKGEKGLSGRDLELILKDDILITPRIKDLLDDGMVYLAGGRYSLTAKGSLFVKIFMLYRGLLDLPKGG